MQKKKYMTSYEKIIMQEGNEDHYEWGDSGQI